MRFGGGIEIGVQGTDFGSWIRNVNTLVVFVAGNSNLTTGTKTFWSRMQLEFFYLLKVIWCCDFGGLAKKSGDGAKKLEHRPKNCTNP